MRTALFCLKTLAAVISLQRAEQRVNPRAQDAPGQLALLLHPPQGGADRLVGAALAQRNDDPSELIERDEDVEDALLHTGHSKAGSRGSMSA